MCSDSVWYMRRSWTSILLQDDLKDLCRAGDWTHCGAKSHPLFQSPCFGSGCGEIPSSNSSRYSRRKEAEGEIFHLYCPKCGAAWRNWSDVGREKCGKEKLRIIPHVLLGTLRSYRTDLKTPKPLQWCEMIRPEPISTSHVHTDRKSLPPGGNRVFWVFHATFHELFYLLKTSSGKLHRYRSIERARSLSFARKLPCKSAQ